jgi:hypothetical protein
VKSIQIGNRSLVDKAFGLYEIDIATGTVNSRRQANPDATFGTGPDRRELTFVSDPEA